MPAQLVAPAGTLRQYWVCTPAQGMPLATEVTVPVGDWPGGQKKCFGFVAVEAAAGDAPTAPTTAATSAAMTAMRPRARADRMNLYLHTVDARTQSGGAMLRALALPTLAFRRLTSQSTGPRAA